MPQRIKLNVEVDLDPIPGTFHTAGQAHESVLYILKERIPHYNPEVNFGGYAQPPRRFYRDRAIFTTPRHLMAGGPFFMAHEAEVNWYCVRSEDPEKHDLWLPPYIFRKCFRFLGNDSFPEEFSLVEEII